jgi:hypothetical protein
MCFHGMPFGGGAPANATRGGCCWGGWYGGGTAVACGSRRARNGQSVKVTGLAQKLGQLEAVNRDFQSKYWANLQFLGQPCNFRAQATRLHGRRR